jgi:hypothetical protein
VEVLTASKGVVAFGSSDRHRKAVTKKVPLFDDSVWYQSVYVRWKRKEWRGLE